MVELEATKPFERKKRRLVPGRQVKVRDVEALKMGQTISNGLNEFLSGIIRISAILKPAHDLLRKSTAGEYT
jgi:hypothetical protein